MNAIMPSARSSAHSMWSAKVGTFISAVPQSFQASSVPGASLGQTEPRRWSQIAKFWEAFNLGLDCADALASDDAMDPPDLEIWTRALNSVSVFASRVSAPLVTPLQLGGVSVEWHVHDIDLEIRFRADAPPFVVTDYVRDEFRAFQGRDPNFVEACKALTYLAARSV